MMNSYTIWFILFAFAAYFIATDENVAKAVYLTGKIVNNKLARFRWWVMHNPRTPWARYFIWRRSLKLARELENEIKMERQSRESNNNSKIIE